MDVFVEAGMRGGISTISHRYAKANNPYLNKDDYVPSENDLNNSYIWLLDSNNLYGWAMSQPICTSGFHFLSPADIAKLDFSNIADDSNVGYFIECDLQYPTALHDLHNDYPLAPEHLRVTDNMLSEFLCVFRRQSFR